MQSAPVPISSVKIQTRAARAVLIAALLAVCALNYFFGKWGLANMASTHADAVEVADLALSLAPGDPQTHYAAAVLYEKSFAKDDIDRSLREYSIVAALSPNNYLFWLTLGNARSRNGDPQGAESALRVAVDLAPNYGSVRWALGNVLLRQGRATESFVEIRKAADLDSNYASPAADIAWQYFDGDVKTVRETIGESPDIIAALITRMAAQKRLDDALNLWNALPVEQKTGHLKANGKVLFTELVSAKRFRDAFRVNSDIASGSSSGSIGRVENGDFEGDIRMNDASVFEWAIGDGLQPKVVLTDGQKHGGSRSLLIVFGGDGKAFRSISQTIAVDPGETYTFEAFCLSDIKNQSSIQWEVVDASDGKLLGTTAPVASSPDWITLTASFSVPSTSDGVIIRLARSGCVTQNCSVNGKAWFDDISLHKK